MAIFKALTFDGVNSLDYGIYITGEAVYNAPERAVEMVNIPGKNGALALDQGRFENIEVTYHAGCFADTQEEFARKVMEFRNALASRFVYKRLTDGYHTDEYRMALYKSGLELSPVRYSTASEFDITFDCKPQRFLIDGDRAISPTEWSDVQTESGELVTIESDGSLAVKSLEVSLSPIQEGSGTPSPTNIRPISGRSEVVTHRTGKNFLPNTATSRTVNGITFTVNSDGSINVNGTATVNASLVIATGWQPPKGTYIVSKGASVNQPTVFLDARTSSGFVRTLVSENTGRGVTATIDYSDYDRFNVGIYVSKGRTVDNVTIYPMVRLASDTDATYEPYQGNTYTTSLGRTVYGGTLDVVSGELVVTEGYIASYNGESLPSTWISDRDVYASGTIPTTGAQVVYKLAEPQTYQLTPQQIDLLLGTNHLWNDGEITLTYGVHPYYNPTPFASKPLIKVTGTGTLGIGEYILIITGTASQTLYIDCETMEIYTIEGTVPTGASSLVSINKNDFPVLEPGTNNISVGSGITNVEIVPRWWRI